MLTGVSQSVRTIFFVSKINSFRVRWRTLYFLLRKQGAEIVPILLSMQVSGGATNGRARAQRLNPLRIIETKLLHIKTTASTGLNNVQTTIFSWKKKIWSFDKVLQWKQVFVLNPLMPGNPINTIKVFKFQSKVDLHGSITKFV